MTLFKWSRLDAIQSDPRHPSLLLDRWVEEGWLRSIDRALARFLADEVPSADPLVPLAAALVSYQLGRGHVCLVLSRLASDPERTLGLSEWQLTADWASRATALDEPLHSIAELQQITLEDWLNALKATPDLCGSDEGNTPLVLNGDRLYLRRNRQYERTIYAGIAQRLESDSEIHTPIEPSRVYPILDQLYANDPLPIGQSVHWQKVACSVAATRAFSIITGGPGTGKTTTVVRLLALLQALHRQPDPSELSDSSDSLDSLDSSETSEPSTSEELIIRLAAPTGKAAARLSESISYAIDGLKLSNLPDSELIRASIPREVTTLHRLLGRRMGTRKPTWRRGNPLPLDILVIDEASMIDLEMMADVMEALPEFARLILLGDKDQLASVEAGAVLGELCQFAEWGRYQKSTAETIALASGEKIPETLLDPKGTDLDQAIVMLRHSFRFPPDKGIGQLAAAVNAGRSSEVAHFFHSSEHPELTLLDQVSGPEFNALVIDGVDPQGKAPQQHDGDKRSQPRRGYRHYLETIQNQRPNSGATDSEWNEWAKSVLEAHNQFQILAAVREGPYGVKELNHSIATLLRQRKLISQTDGWYEGRPVMVTRNDYTLGLMNGDVGITLSRASSVADTNVLRIAFLTAKGVQWISTTRLSEVETVYALTVHKSQGSEFTHTLLVLPETTNPILTRELFYTAITRSRTWLSLCNPGGDTLLESTVANRVERASGLLEE